MDLDMVGMVEANVDSVYSVVVVGIMFELDGEAVVLDNDSSLATLTCYELLDNRQQFSHSDLL